MGQELTTQEFKTIYVKRIASGEWESKILAELNMEWIEFHEICARDPDFRVQIDNARKGRAEKWVERIASSLEQQIDPMTDLPIPIRADEVPAKKLEFEKLKFLAMADNPDRYNPSNKGGVKVDVNVDLAEFKLLPPAEAMKALASDPFAKLAVIDGVEVQSRKKEDTPDESN